MVVTKVRERLAVRKQAAQKFDVVRFNLRKLSELEVRKQYQIEISDRFAALENLSDGEDINRAWENIKESVRTSAKESLELQELKQHKPWFDEECSRFLYQRKQAKMQWVQDANHRNVDNTNNGRREASRYFRKNRRNIWKVKLMKLKLTVRTKISYNCIGALVKLRRATNLEIT